jgi:UDP-N-acetylglucosamine--N-acetylmuramyl-(pentapeptide) pyrophosphoryl-undecaprenol N-acetylglucosamine transferase
MLQRALGPRPARLTERAAASRKTVVIAAGGTGGHLFPAQALAEALVTRGWRIVLATDDRVQGIADRFPAERQIALSAATFRPGDILGLLRALWAIFRGVLQARAAFSEIKPAVVVGFGGYPSLPALLAAISQGWPTVIHEQNAVMGRANRLLARFVTKVACAFPVLSKAPGAVQARAEVVGNPVRPEIRALYDRPYEPPTDEFRLLITGGSQGARLLSELPPAAIRKLPENVRLKMKVVQQTRIESMEGARKAYADAMVQSEIAPFFRDIASRLGAAHLVIGRAGASTVYEIAVAGKPSILVPLKIAIDDDQGQNARVLAEAGAAEVAREADLDVASLSSALATLIAHPARLAKMAAAARSVANPDAAERLADLVESTAR